MDFALFDSIWTVVVLVVFVAIVIWAFSPKRKQELERAARIPLEDDDDARPAGRDGRAREREIDRHE